MKIKTSKILGLFISIIVLHFLANQFGIYERQMESGFVWFDNILHFFSGIAFAFLWLWIAERKNINRSFVQIMAFVLFTAVVWELVEFGFLKAFSSQALEFKIYSPSIMEASEDIISNLLGGALLVFGLKNLKKG
jgi:uncharacterized membrane protein YjdF